MFFILSHLIYNDPMLISHQFINAIIIIPTFADEEIETQEFNALPGSPNQ